MLQWLKNLIPRTADLFGAPRSSQWRRVRAEHLRNEPVCQACGRDKNLDVHHIIPVAFDSTRELDPENLITLCSDPCHRVFGHFLSYHCYNKDVRAMVLSYKQAFDQRVCRTPNSQLDDDA